MVPLNKSRVTLVIIFYCFTIFLPSFCSEQPLLLPPETENVSTPWDEDFSIQLPQKQETSKETEQATQASKNKKTDRGIAEAAEKEEPTPVPKLPPEQRRINKIIISGNKFTSQEAILNYVPYRVGELFDPRKTGQLIKNVYHGLKRFRNVIVKGEDVGDDLINIHVIVEEKKILKDIIFKGNKAITEKEISKKVDITEIPAIDEQELKVYAQHIKKLYLEKGYHQTEIDTELTIDDDGRAIATFIIHEGKKALIKQIMFTGNEHVTDKELRGILFTREDWILSFLDKTGLYHPERLEGDKHMIQQLYQNRGFMQAKVTDVIVDMDPKTQHIKLIFEIEEGPQYIIKSVRAPGNDILPEEYLLAHLPVRPGQIYSRERIANAIKALETIWGNHGYIFANIEPSIQPDEDTKTVELNFISDLGKKIYLNRITIRGNKKTRDKILRRKIPLEEGEILVNGLIEAAQRNIESLGYFEQRDGVNWKLHRLDNEHADLDFIVKEAKTGHANIQIGFGGAGASLNSPADGVNVKGNITDTNLFGSGTYLNLEASWAKKEQTILFHLAQPWLFDKPVSGALDIYHKRPTYNDLRNIDISAVNEKITGGALTVGWITRSTWAILNDTQILGTLGINSVQYEKLPKASISGASKKTVAEYQSILDKEFTPGEYVWLACNLEQEARNHPMHPSRGHRWKITSKVGIPSLDSKIGFYSLHADAHWFTPLIDEFNLVLHLHGFLGLSTSIGDNSIPFSELFNIGGPATVRGFLFGQIGPKFLGDPIGAKKAFFINVELIFPITPDFNMKGVAFYDGGAGWDASNTRNISCENIIGNNFDYRHSVGLGIRILNPMPVKIDWGFKLDARKGESASEVHFGMTYDW